MSKLIYVRFKMRVYEESEPKLYAILHAISPKQRARYLRNCLIAMFSPATQDLSDGCRKDITPTTHGTGVPTINRNDDLLLEMVTAATDRVEGGNVGQTSGPN